MRRPGKTSFCPKSVPTGTRTRSSPFGEATRDYGSSEEARDSPFHHEDREVLRLGWQRSSPPPAGKGRVEAAVASCQPHASSETGSSLNRMRAPMQRLVVWRTPFLVLSASRTADFSALTPRLLCVAGAERKLLPMGHMTAVTSEPVCTDKTRALTIRPSCTDKTTQKLQSL